MNATKFKTFLFDQLSLIKFLKNLLCFNSTKQFEENQPVKI